MILFVGTEERGYFIEEASRMEVKFSGYVPDLEKIIDSVILSQSYSHIIIDAEMLVNDYNTIAELSKRIMSAVPSPLIFLTPGYSEDTELIRSLRRSGVFNFIMATSLPSLPNKETNSLNIPLESCTIMAEALLLLIREKRIYGSLVLRNKEIPLRKRYWKRRHINIRP